MLRVENRVASFNPKGNSKPRQSGFSLVEIMVALTLGMIISFGLTVLLSQSSQTYKVQDEFARMQENGTYALRYMGDAIRAAGFYGLMSNTQDVNISQVSTAAGNDCRGANWAFTVNEPFMVYTGLTSANVSTTFTCVDSANFKDGFALAVRFAGGTQVPAVNLVDNSVYIQAEPNTALLFYGADYVTLLSNAATKTIMDPANHTNFIEAPIYEYNTQLYYIRPCSRPTGGTAPYQTCQASDDSGKPIPTLVRQELGVGAANETVMLESAMVEGVEQFNMVFGVDSDNDGAADIFTLTPTAAQMTDIVQVQVYFLIRSSNTTLGYDDSGKTYDLGGGTTFDCTAAGAPCDYRRHVFSQTFQIRNITIRKQDGIISG